MASISRNLCYIIWVVLFGLHFNSCSEIDDLDTTQGALRFSITQVSVKTESRATPSELGKPLASRFNLKIQRKGTSLIPYDGQFQESLQIKTGTYHITATCGEDVIIGRNAPYYVGTADDVVVEKDVTTPVSIPCSVANSLISVKFGMNEEERARFDRHYDDFGVIVGVGNYSLEIPKDDTGSSIYFRAGSSPKLYFYGKLKGDNASMISYELTSNTLPKVFAKAQHAIVTLNLSATIVTINKVAVEDANMDETIPVSWLPVPTATAIHQYDEVGDLVGTNVTFSNSYPGMNWKAVVVNANGEEVRSVERSVDGTGELCTEYNDSQDWPYLPQGNYKAHYYFVNGETLTKVSDRDFVIGKPEITLTVGGYSSYTKYIDGDIDGANACDGNSIYDASVKLHVSKTILSSSRYKYSLYSSLEETSKNETNGSNTHSYPVLNKLKARSSAYTLSASAEFDGVTVETYRRFYITGVPFLSAPPTTKNWSSVNDVTDENGYALLGETSWDENQCMIYSVYIPTGTNILLDYKFDTRGGKFIVDITNTFTISSNDNVWVECTATNETKKNEGTKIINAATPITEVRCNNVNGANDSYTKLYRVGMKYVK